MPSIVAVKLEKFLKQHTTPLAATMLMQTIERELGPRLATLDVLVFRELADRIRLGVKMLGGKMSRETLLALRTELAGGASLPAATRVVPVTTDTDVMVCQRVATQLGRAYFSSTDVVRIATAVSELARNIYMYAGGGQVSFRVVEEGGDARIEVIASDKGPGIANLSEILGGGYRSKTGLGRGLLGVKTLMDFFEVTSTRGVGTTVQAHKKTKVSWD